MLKNIADIDRLAKDAIRVEHFATMELIGAHPDDLVSEVRAWMLVNDFEVAPLLSDSLPGFLLRVDLEAIDGNQRVCEAQHSLQEAVIVRPETPFIEALDKLEAHGWFFVAVEGIPQGIVTRQDLGRPAVSLYLFARILALEAGLRRLLGTFTNTPIPDSPSVDGSEGDPSQFSNVRKLVQKNDDLRFALGFSSKSEFEKKTSFIVDLRNDLAHGRNILARIEDPKLAVTRVHDIDALLERVSSLTADRDQVWEAFARTHVVHRTVIERFWVGPNAIPLPMPAPIFVITAANPFEEVLSGTQNDRRNEVLRELLKARSLEFIEVLGQSPDRNWVESSFAVGGMSRTDACELARTFGQRAVFELDEHKFRVISADETVRSEQLRNSGPSNTETQEIGK